MRFSNVIGAWVMLGALGVPGCISDSGDNDGLPPPSGVTAQDIVIEAMEGLHFLSSPSVEGEPREIVTYEGDSGQICMAILGFPYPNLMDSDEQDAHENEWFVYSAQATQTWNDSGGPLFYGKVYWDDGSEDWTKVGDYVFSQNEDSGTVYLSPDTSIKETRLVNTGTNIDSFVSLLEPCSKLSNPSSGDPLPSTQPPPAPTPI